MPNYNRRSDDDDLLLPTIIFGTIGTMLLLAIAAFFVDVFIGIQAQPAQYECEAKRMDYRRVSFSTRVICVPKSLDTRNDTLTIQR